jgi:hypothetical protein
MLRWFRKKPSPVAEVSSQKRATLPKLAGDGTFSQEIVGEAAYQEAIAAIVGRKSERSARVVCRAVVSLEDNNPHDEFAVVVRINSRVVGYLSRKVNYAYREQLRLLDPASPPVFADAVIVGGWKDEESEGHFGVFLDMTWPPRFTQDRT